MDYLNIFKLSFLVSFLNLDNQNFLSIGISRPIIAGAIIGYFIDNLYFGILVGCIIELMYINLLPVGSYIPPNGVITTAIVLFLSFHFHVFKIGTLLPLILIYGIICGHIIKRFIRLLWKKNTFFVERFIKDIESNKINFFKFNLLSMLIDFFVYAILTYLGFYIGTLLFQFILKVFFVSFYLNYLLENVLIFLPLFALSYLLNSFDVPNKTIFIFFGIISTVIINFIIKSPIILFIFIGLLSYLVFYVSNLYKEYFYEL